MNTVPAPRLYLALVTVTWGLISALTSVRGNPAPSWRSAWLKLSRLVALPKLLPHCCLPFLPWFCRQVGSIFHPLPRSDCYRRGRVLSRCHLLPLPMVHQEGSRFQDRSVRTKNIGLRFLRSHFDRLNVGNMLAQGLGGLIAAGVLSGLEGARGIRGWRWVRSSPFPPASVSPSSPAFHYRRLHHHRLRAPRSIHPRGLPL